MNCGKMIYIHRKIGEKFDDFKFYQTDSKKYTFTKIIKITLSFHLFSRCPIPNMCPAVSKNQYLADSFSNRNIDFLF